MQRNKNTELVRQFGMNPNKPDSFQAVNEPLMNNLLLWSQEDIDLQNVIQTFFNIKVRTKIVAILLDLDLNNWVGLGASWQHNNQNGQIRIDSKLTEFLLNKAFGESPINSPFSMKKINQLELNILQSFLINLENKMKEHWELDAKHPFLMDVIYLVWLIESEDKEIGRIAFGMPASFRPKIAAKPQELDKIDINQLANTGITVPVNFLVGGTKITLNEVKSLELGDFIVLEDSDIGRFYWHLGEIGIVLPEEDHPVFVNDVEKFEEVIEEMKKTPHVIDEDPLSSLPLELSAEFHKVLITLKQLLELKSGGVLPLGSVLDSELVLTAQGKPVAKGELVIIGNQFGMRITELLLSTKKHSKGQSGVEIDDILPTQTAQKTEQANFAEELKDLEDN